MMATTKTRLALALVAVVGCSLTVLTPAFAHATPRAASGSLHQTQISAVPMTASRSTRILQLNLRGLNYYTGAIDGIRGPQTNAALAHFNRDYNGVIPLTLVVTQVQQKAGTSADRIYGDVTTSKVRTWQSHHRLIVDGIAGAKTRTSMGIPLNCQCGWG